MMKTPELPLHASRVYRQGDVSTVCKSPCDSASIIKALPPCQPSDSSDEELVAVFLYKAGRLVFTMTWYKKATYGYIQHLDKGSVGDFEVAMTT